MRAIALDIGQKRIGIATSDSTGTIASPLCVLPAADILQGSSRWRRILEDYEPDVLVCGKPKTMHGEVGPQAQRVMQLAHKIAASCALPLEYVDERLSSAEAKRILHAEGLNEKEMRGKVDMVAASLFLQTWLDSQHR
ncbi:MAG: Holliday junction resolvase RuvX [Atopobiaceae bacterium]|jgi:putative Holliday junction resolvase